MNLYRYIKKCTGRATIKCTDNSIASLFYLPHTFLKQSLFIIISIHDAGRFKAAILIHVVNNYISVLFYYAT